MMIWKDPLCHKDRCEKFELLRCYVAKPLGRETYGDGFDTRMVFRHTLDNQRSKLLVDEVVIRLARAQYCVVEE